MDEADRILNMDFEVEVDKILKVIPRERRTFLFSATMTKKVQKLQRASLQDPVKVEVSTKYQTVDKLQQYYVFIPVKYKVSEKEYNKVDTLVYSCFSSGMFVSGRISCSHFERNGGKFVHDLLLHL